MTSSYLLGIDLGTSSLKSVIIDEDGEVLSIATRSYDIDQPRAGWAEQHPSIWQQAAIATIRQVLAQSRVPPMQIIGISLSGQMHGLVVVDGNGDVLRPAIIWADQRSSEQVRFVEEKIGSHLVSWTGNPLATGFMLPSWLWLRQYEPEAAASTRRLLLPKDYLRFWLTQTFGTEPSDAGSTGMFSPVAGEWSGELLTALEIDSTLLPDVFASSDIAGGLTAATAKELGLRVGTPVVYGGADQACQALGNGILTPGDVSCTIGTGGQLLAPTTVPAVDPELRLHLYNHVVPDLWWSMGAILSAGLSLSWLGDKVLLDITYQAMADMATTAPPGSDGLFFMPHLAGERTPHMDASARGAFFGLTLRHDRKHMVRASMEGVVFALRQALDLMVELGVTVDKVVASGGGSSHPLWLQLQADIFNRPIYLTQMPEAAAVGAALLAGIGTGMFNDADDAVMHIRHWSDKVIYPQNEHASTYEEAYATYRLLYPTMQPLFTRIGDQRVN